MARPLGLGPGRPRREAGRGADLRPRPEQPRRRRGSITSTEHGEELEGWLTARLVPQPLPTFTEATRVTGAVDSIPGTAIHCRPLTDPFDRFGEAVGYRTRALDAPHNVTLTHPEPLARMLLEASGPGTPREFVRRTTVT